MVDFPGVLNYNPRFLSSIVSALKIEWQNRYYIKQNKEGESITLGNQN